MPRATARPSPKSDPVSPAVPPPEVLLPAPDRSTSPHRSVLRSRLLVPKVEAALRTWDDVSIGKSAATVLPYLGISDPLMWLGKYQKLGAFARRTLLLPDPTNPSAPPKLSDPIAHVIMEAAISSGIVDVGDLCHIAIHASACASFLSVISFLHDPAMPDLNPETPS